MTIFGDADFGGANLVDPSGERNLSPSKRAGDAGVRLEVLELHEHVLLGEDGERCALAVAIGLRSEALCDVERGLAVGEPALTVGMDSTASGLSRAFMAPQSE